MGEKYIYKSEKYITAEDKNRGAKKKRKLSTFFCTWVCAPASLQHTSNTVAELIENLMLLATIPLHFPSSLSRNVQQEEKVRCGGNIAEISFATFCWKSVRGKNGESSPRILGFVVCQKIYIV